MQLLTELLGELLRLLGQEQKTIPASERHLSSFLPAGSSSLRIITPLRELLPGTPGTLPRLHSNLLYFAAIFLFLSSAHIQQPHFLGSSPRDDSIVRTNPVWDAVCHAAPSANRLSGEALDKLTPVLELDITGV